jgi:IS30 family transposase
VISFKSIYKWLYSAYGQPFCQYLPSQKWHPRKRKSKKGKKVLIPNRVSIEKRPEIINLRARCGDFEADTLGVPRKSLETLAGMADRKSRYFLAKKIPRIRYAIEGFKRLSSSLNHLYSFTLDNGLENIRHQELGVLTFFCYAYAAWEKPTIENSFQRLRRFIPKKSKLQT